jgi:hypothetical protein
MTADSHVIIAIRTIHCPLPVISYYKYLYPEFGVIGHINPTCILSCDLRRIYVKLQYNPIVATAENPPTIAIFRAALSILLRVIIAIHS